MAKKKLQSLTNLPILGPGDSIGEGDTYIKHNLLLNARRDEINSSLPLSDTIFHALYHEVQWQKMYHAAGEVPRLVAVQGIVSKDDSMPIYRHPSDQAPPLHPYTKHVDIVRKECEKVVGHQLNHVLIQLYRDGKDYISEHSDKTLDIVRGSSIVNASFGAQRTMRLRTKKSGSGTGVAQETEDNQRITQRIPMPHNSIFVLGLKTNQMWLHGINADKRLAAERSDEEKAYNGMRISLTFRNIGTFLSKDEKEIWGQGAKGKTVDDAGKVVNGDKEETEKMIYAFGDENHKGEGFDWDKVYGDGFDVLHFRDNNEEVGKERE
jgi:alkylated DNA repair dioxygenase AlkB